MQSGYDAACSSPVMIDLNDNVLMEVKALLPRRVASPANTLACLQGFSVSPRLQRISKASLAIVDQTRASGLSAVGEGLPRFGRWGGRRRRNSRLQGFQLLGHGRDLL